MKIKSIKSDVSACKTGEVIHWDVEGDKDSSLLDCHWRIFKDGEEYWVIGWTDALGYDFKVTEPGEYRMQVRLKDADGNRSDYAKSSAVKVEKGEEKEEDIFDLLTEIAEKLEKVIERL